jgi:hypothetical protein
MTEYRVWAYAVVPSRTTSLDAAPAPRGGRVPYSDDLREALVAAATRAREGAWTRVNFRTEQVESGQGRRSNDVRDALLALAFGDEAGAHDAAEFLGRRLAEATDNRSRENLLVLMGSVVDGLGSVRVWTFPRDDAFRFDEAIEPAIELLAGVFSRTSGLRKAATFDGENHDSSFVGGDALDFQSGDNSADVANYWIGRFLECALGVTPRNGTLHLVKALKKLDASLENPGDRRALSIAALAIGQSPTPNVSLSSVAETLLPEHLRQALLDASDNHAMDHRPFALDRELFQSQVARQQFFLESGVVVATPLTEVFGPGDVDDGGRSVFVDGDQLRVEGRITKEKLSGRRGQAA